MKASVQYRVAGKPSRSVRFEPWVALLVLAVIAIVALLAVLVFVVLALVAALAVTVLAVGSRVVRQGPREPLESKLRVRTLPGEGATRSLTEGDRSS